MRSSTPPFKPALILHGGAGNIQRKTLPPDLYAAYHASLQSYLRSTREYLENGASALDAAVHAVSLMEDDELFNCGRGSVFTTAGTIEMEASVMVTSVYGDEAISEGGIKRGVGVMGIRNVRHPIQLARESLLRTGYASDGSKVDDGGNMHSQLHGQQLELLARDWGLEFKPDEWFWTQTRWDEHKRGLKGEAEPRSMSQGTVGCVCLDKWGNLATATSTGGLTNKLPGRIGDTPTLGAGFWAEAWDETRLDCTRRPQSPEGAREEQTRAVRQQPSKRAIAVSGTGNGDSFLRVAAARTAGAMTRFSAPGAVNLAYAMRAVAGPDGELQRSAGERWNITPEGEGGIIGIEAEVSCLLPISQLHRGIVVHDFNCSGMWRAWCEDNGYGEEVERIMVFREEYK